jgi:hypothetical protein
MVFRPPTARVWTQSKWDRARLRRLEKNRRDGHVLLRCAEQAGISEEQARGVLDAFFTDFLNRPEVAQ